MNLGDEAILEGILGELRAGTSAEITVFSKNPADTLERHQVERAVNSGTLTRKEITPRIRELDVLVLGGGGILFDGERRESVADDEDRIVRVCRARQRLEAGARLSIEPPPLVRPLQIHRTALGSAVQENRLEPA